MKVGVIPVNIGVQAADQVVQTAQFVDLKAKIPSPPAVVLSTDKKFITFLKLRLEFVAVGEFEFPNAEITDPFKVE